MNASYEAFATGEGKPPECALSKFRRRESHCCPSRHHMEGNFKLGQWVSVQRYGLPTPQQIVYWFKNAWRSSPRLQLPRMRSLLQDCEGSKVRFEWTIAQVRSLCSLPSPAFSKR